MVSKLLAEEEEIDSAEVRLHDSAHARSLVTDSNVGCSLADSDQLLGILRHSVPYSIPRLFHFLSIIALISGSMMISSGQGREKPSVDHLRVASIPILEP